MSKIVILINSDAVSANILFELKKGTGESVEIIRKNISDHKPILEKKLFYNDHWEVSDKLLKVLKELIKNEVPYSIFELREDEGCDTERSKKEEIDLETLQNIIDRHNREINRQENL